MTELQAKIQEKKSRIQKKNDTATFTVMCKTCNDTGFIFFTDKDGYSYAEKCKCRIVQEQKEMIERSGLSGFWRGRTFETFIAQNEEQKLVKQRCIDCVNQNKSAIICGQIGSGKTHLGIAMLLNYADKGEYIKYTNYMELVRELSQNVMDGEYYIRLIGQYKNIDVLLLDDLFKGRATEAQLKYIYEIVNHRYNKQKKTIITTEKNIDELFEIDEAIVSRLVQMSDGFVVSMQGIKNQRLEKR